MTAPETRPSSAPAHEGGRYSIITVALRFEQDVVLVRQRARQVAELLGLDVHAQTRFATAVSEVARNAHEYAGGGRAEFALECPPGGTHALAVRISDNGPGIRDLDAVLTGRYRSPNGMGLGLVGARRLCDWFHVESTPGAGTTVDLWIVLPPGSPACSAREAQRIADELSRSPGPGPIGELQRQNQELLRTIDELHARRAEVERLNSELQETNRGVLALYSELDDRAEDLRRASEYKTRFLSEVSHEFRTPLTSVLNISRLLLDRADGPLTSEQERQVSIIRNAVNNLAELVNDLLDVARIEAGKTTIRPAHFSAMDLFAGLRGIFRPLATHPAVTLVIEEPSGIPPLYGDEARVAQILRNFISNALKFTESGQVRLNARTLDGDRIAFAVSDTGIGIAPEHHKRVFDEFAQVDSPIQRRVRGTGLGLPLSRRLARLLGGEITLESRLGEGSTFTLFIPREWTPTAAAAEPGREERR
jgi:signal transduction histidine kinase